MQFRLGGSTLELLIEMIIEVSTLSLEPCKPKQRQCEQSCEEHDEPPRLLNLLLGIVCECEQLILAPCDGTESQDHSSVLFTPALRRNPDFQPHSSSFLRSAPRSEAVGICGYSMA